MRSLAATSFPWRNVWRRRRRSAITIGAIAVVTFVSIVYFGFGGAAKNSMYQASTEASGHVHVRPARWTDARTWDDATIADASSVRATIDGAVAATMPGAIVVGVLDVPALLSSGQRARGVTMHGREWPARIQSRRTEGATWQGRFVETPGEVVLGASLARALDVSLGDTVTADAPGGGGSGRLTLQVVGLVDLLNANEEIGTVWTLLSDAQRLHAPGRVGRFEIHDLTAVRVSDDAASVALVESLDAALPADVEALSWRDVDPSIEATLEALDPLLYVATAMVFVLAGLLVLNTVYLGVMERIREFGVLHALGAGDRRVIAWITTESLLLCTIGTIVGTGLGLGTVAVYRDGLVIASLTEYYASFGFDPVFYLSVTLVQVVFTVVFALVTGVAAAAWPAYLASRLEPVEAMRFHA